MKFLGIDLGTANTYIYGSDDPRATPAPVVIQDISDASGSISTVVLYENGKAILAGNMAEAEYYSQPALRKNRVLASQFKPEIGLADNDALAATSDFLRIIRTSLPPGTLEESTSITVGIPALAREDFRLNLTECFIRAGWPKPMFARESDAALVSCLQSGALHVEDIRGKCLILDFGGGTCDFTLIESLDALQNGGDVLYGGRLFDDLFYKAFYAANVKFAREAPDSPYAWHAHWLECREQKEIFSDFVNRQDTEDGGISLGISWIDSKGEARKAFLHDFGKDEFLHCAENYSASPELLEMLAPYKTRGGLGQNDRDLLAGLVIGLLNWLSSIFASINNPGDVVKVILTGGSSRWFFVKDLAARHFPAARIIESVRGYEDIAFGLALFPALEQSCRHARELLEQKLPAFTERTIEKADALLKKQSEKIVHLCGQRIVERDIMPVLEAAQKQPCTVGDLEKQFTKNIADDSGLIGIVEENSRLLREKLQETLNFDFRRWLQANGVPLTPNFSFPVQVIGRDFFQSVSVKISRLDSLNLMAFTAQKILPVLAGTATAGAIAHTGEPVSTIIGGGVVFGATWLIAKTVPSFLQNRKLPSFILNEHNRKKIAEKNREYIESALAKALEDTHDRLMVLIRDRLRESLNSMIQSLTALNQVRIRQDAI